MYRQGDVVIIPVEKITKDLGVEQKDLVLARGKVTGHSHRITQGNAKLFINAGGLMLLKILSEHATLGHEEHEDIILPDGDYSVLIQREYDWFNQEVKNVQD